MIGLRSIPGLDDIAPAIALARRLDMQALFPALVASKRPQRGPRARLDPKGSVARRRPLRVAGNVIYLS